MTKRNPFAVFILGFITLGIYSIYWYVKTKGEMNAQGEKIPTAWLLIIPIVNWWWLWKYSEGVDHVSKQKMSKVLTFVLLFLLGSIGQAIVQDTFNGLSTETAGNSPAVSPGPTATDTNSPAQTASPSPSVSQPTSPPASTEPLTPVGPTPSPTPTTPTETPPQNNSPTSDTPTTPKVG